MFDKDSSFVQQTLPLGKVVLDVVSKPQETYGKISREQPPIDRWYDDLVDLVHKFDDPGNSASKEFLERLTDLRDDMHWYLRG